MMIKKKGIDFTAVQNPDYCEQPLLLSAKDSCLVYFDENTQKRPSYVSWFTHSTGSAMEGEMSDTYYGNGDGIPYHEHNLGHEIFLLEGGSAEVYMRGMRAVADSGDIVFVPPFTSHGFKFLSDPTIWREWFQGIKMNEGLLEERRFQMYGDPSVGIAYFDEKLSSRLGTDWFSFDPVMKDVSKSELPYIRDYDFSFGTFEFPGIKMLQKIARYEMNGNIEFWQYRMDEGFCMSADMWNPHGIRWSVYSGSVKVEIPKHDSFIAEAKDIINIPSYMPCRLTACEGGAVVHDFACKGYLFRAMEHIMALKASNDSILKDEKAMAKLFEEKYDLFTMWNLGA